MTSPYSSAGLSIVLRSAVSEAWRVADLVTLSNNDVDFGEVVTRFAPAKTRSTVVIAVTQTERQA